MKKSKMIRKRLASMILSFVMLFGEFYSGGMTVFAGDEDVIVDDFDTDVEDAMIDHPVEEEDIDHAAATWVNVVTSGSHVTLRPGDSNGNASFSNGILTLKNYQVYDNSGGYTPIYQGGEVTGNPYYGIYADGDLIIEVEGENVFDLGLSSETTAQYGIYAKGSLTIRNVSGKDGSLEIDLNGKGGSGNAPTTCGAYAALGNLTIEEQKGGSLDVDVYGNVAKSNTVANMEALGIRSEGSNVYIKGGDISIYTVAGNRSTKGISGQYYFQTGGNVTVKPAQTTGNSTKQTIGIFGSYGVEVTGGSLDCTANNATAASGGISYGVYTQSDIKFLSETQITAGSTDGGRSVGVFSEANNGVFSLLCKSTIKAGDYAILVSKIDNIGYCYVKPSPATVKTALSENGRTYFSVFDKSGNVAKEIQTDKEEGYPVWVGGIRLTDNNKNAIPSVESGSASYDPQTKTLTLKGVKTISGAFNPAAGDQALIYANDDLIIELESDSELPMVTDDTVTNQYGIAAKGNLTIRNVSGKNASLDLDMYCDGSGSGKVSNGYAIYCSGNLTIEENNGGSLSLDITDNLTTYLAYCMRSDGTVSVTGGDIDITTLPAGTARGISAITYEQSGGDVLIEALKKSGIRNYNNLSSLEAVDITVTGGKLTAYAGKGFSSSRGISCTKSFVLGKNGEVDCAGGGANYEANDNGLFGDFDCDGNNKIVIGGKFHAAAKSNAVNTKTMSAGDSVLNVKSAISLANGVMLLKPEGGNVDGGGNDAARRFIADSSGKPAAEVVTGFTSMHEVKFDLNGNGSSTPATQYVEDGKYATEPTAPVADGYNFGGWYTESSCSNKFSFSTAIKKDYTLYAKWTEKAKVYYTVSFDMNGHGSQIASQSIESGKTATQPSNPSATGYTFGGWYTEKSCTTKYNFSTAVKANITLYAKWTPLQYTVYFNANGHGTAPSAVKVNYGAKVSKPTDPTASGYTFGGWYKESSCTNLYDFSTAVTSSFTLYAKWTENAKVYYTVTFNANGHGTAPAAQQVESGKYATQPTAPTATGYTFGGWYKEASCTNAYNFNTAVTANITLYAKWTENAKVYYTVTFNANGHGTAPSAQRVESGNTATQPTAPTATGYTFGGWYKEAACTNAYSFSTTVTANITLYAKWTINQYTVTFNANGHGTAPSAVKVNYGAKVSKPTDPAVTGYTFGGWYKEAGCTNQYNFNSTVTSDITLYAKWTINQYTVTFSANGHGTAPSAVKVNYGAKVSKPTDPTADGYTFGGWYTESSCVNAYDFSSAVTKNITLYAKWTVIQYTVTFNANGHGTAPSAVKVNWGAKVSKPTDPAADGYIFGGWYKEAACTNSYDFNSAVKSSFTLYAKWTQKEPEKVYYTVTFEMNGHGSAITAQTVESGKTVTKPTNPTEDGYTFGGWYTESSCVNAYDFSNAVTKDITLYAKWTVIQFTVTFNANGHGTAPSAVTVNWGEKISKPADLKADGYTFGGWYTDSKCTSAYNFNNLVKSSFTLYAKWTQIRYVVTFNANGHGSAPASVSVNWGEKVTKPEDPKADGYTFGGWYTESSCKNAYDFNTAVKSNITLYAKWTQIELIVTFYINSDDSAPSAVMVKWGTKVSRPDDPKKDGYKFAGWYTDRDYKKEYDFDTLVKEDLSLYAKWTEILTVTFDNNGHGKKPDAQKVVKGEKATEPSALSEKGYIFGGWYTEKECSRRFDFDTAITANITLYAKWDEKKADIEYFTVSFSLNGKSGNVPPQQTIEKGKTAVAPAAPSAEGYSFEGWYTDKNGTEKYDFSTAVTKDITLYAKWNELILTVTFDANGHGIAPANQEVKYGAKAVKPADPSADGYVFGGWFKEAACTALYDFSSPVKADITLYAFWSEESEEPEPGPEPGPDPIEGGLSPLDPYPSLDASTTDLYLVKGQHFNIGAGWVVNKADKKYLSISKKGALKTKKTGEAQISYGDHIVTVHISKPSVTKSLKLTFAEAGETPGAQIEIVKEDRLDVLWYSAAPDVATVDQNGYVTAVAQGKAKITAYINGSAYNCTVSVKEKVAADNRSIHIDAGTSKKLSLKGMKGAIWSSSSDSVAMVINGKILARSTGTAVLTADNGIKVNVIVEKSGITGLDGGKNKYKLSMDEGEDYDLEFESLERTVVFKSSKPDIAFIDEFGHIVARKAGKAKFTTKINGKTITVYVVVEKTAE